MTTTQQTASASVWTDLSHDAALDSHAVATRSRALRHRVPWLVIADVAGVLVTVGLVGLLHLAATPAVAAAVVTVWAALLLTIRPGRDSSGALSRLRSVLLAGLSLAALCWLVPIATHVPATDRQLALLTLVAVGTAVGARLLGALLHDRLRTRRVLLLGNRADVRRTAGELGRTGGCRWEIAGACSPAEAGLDDGFDDVPSLAVRPISSLSEVRSAAAEVGADAVVVMPCEHVDPTLLRRLAWDLEEAGTDLYVGTALLGVSAARTKLTRAGAVGVVRVQHRPRSGLRLAAKSVSERVLCVATVIALLPLLALIAVAVRRDSPGPAIFRQQRVGRNGELFTMYKFRTMRTDAETVKQTLADQSDGNGVLFKMHADPRITRVGRVLRKYSLDELPQLFNVILGQMSLVGPRPALQTEVAQYSLDPRRRLAVKPGLTGLWQVSGRSDLSWEDSVRLDVEYVDNWSLALDVAIMARTLGAVLGHRGAY